MMENNKTLCPLPWMSIETTPLGSTRICCLSREIITDDNGYQMNIQDNGILPMFESNYVKNIRQQMIDGIKPANCKLCWDEEDIGKQSKRHVSIEQVNGKVDSSFFQQSEKGQLRFLDLKLGNLCNLKCRICGSWSSSKWAKEEIDITNSKWAKNTLKLGAWPDESNIFWHQVEQLLSQIDYIEITGGEPFMIENHFRFLKKAIETGDSKRIHIHYNSNGTHLPQDALDNIWPHFKMIDVTFSVDDLGDRFHYQRYPAKWDELIKNLDVFWQYRKKCNNFITQICCTVSIFNVFYLDEICQWIENQPFDGIIFNLLHGEPEFNIKNLPDKFKDKIKNKIQVNLLPALMQEQISNVFAFMNLPADTNMFKKRKQVIDASDKYRSQNFLETFPELREIYETE